MLSLIRGLLGGKHLYAKDLSCTDSIEAWLKSSGVIPTRVVPEASEDFLGLFTQKVSTKRPYMILSADFILMFLQERPETTMIYFGKRHKL